MPAHFRYYWFLVVGCLPLFSHTLLLAEELEPSAILRGHKNETRCVCFSSDGKLLASWASGDATLRLWDVTSGKQEKSFPIRRQHRHYFDLSHDGKTLMMDDWRGDIQSWDVETGKEKHAPWRKPELSWPKFSADSKLVAAADGEWTVRVLNAITGKEVCTVNDPHMFRLGWWPEILKFELSPNGSTLAMERENVIRLWDTASGKLKAILKHEPLPPPRKPFGQHGMNLDFNPFAPDERENCEVTQISFSPNGKVLLSQSGKTVRLWNADTGKEVISFKGRPILPIGTARPARFSPDGAIVAAVTENRTMGLWDANTGQLLRKLDHSCGIGTGPFSPDGKCLAVRDTNKSIHLWDVTTGKRKATLKYEASAYYYSSSIAMIAFSPDGKLLAAACTDGPVRLWNISGDK